MQVLYTLAQHEPVRQEQSQGQHRRQDLEITLLDKYGHLAVPKPLLVTIIREKTRPSQSQSSLEIGKDPIKSIIITTKSQHSFSHAPKTEPGTSHHPHPHPPKTLYRPYRGPHAVPRLLRPVLFPMLLGTFVGFLVCTVGFIAGRVFRGEMREREHERECDEPKGDALVGDC